MVSILSSSSKSSKIETLLLSKCDQTYCALSNESRCVVVDYEVKTSRRRRQRVIGDDIKIGNNFDYDEQCDVQISLTLSFVVMLHLANAFVASVFIDTDEKYMEEMKSSFRPC